MLGDCFATINMCYEEETRRMAARESSISYNYRNHSNSKEAYTDGSKSTGRKVGFLAVLMDIIRREHYQKARRSLYPHS